MEGGREGGREEEEIGEGGGTGGVISGGVRLVLRDCGGVGVRVWGGSRVRDYEGVGAGYRRPVAMGGEGRWWWRRGGGGGRTNALVAPGGKWGVLDRLPCGARMSVEVSKDHGAMTPRVIDRDRAIPLFNTACLPYDGIVSTKATCACLPYDTKAKQIPSLKPP
jgi:hypothetical protein